MFGGGVCAAITRSTRRRGFSACVRRVGGRRDARRILGRRCYLGFGDLGDLAMSSNGVLPPRRFQPSELVVQKNNSSSVVVAMRAGYEDARMNYPFNSFWIDNPDRGIAQSYENGRLAAVNIRSAGLILPEWPFEIAPVGYCEARDKSFDLVGAPITVSAT